MRRVLLAFVLLSLAGCDSLGTDIVALDDVLVVDLVAVSPTSPPVLGFVTEGTPGCATPIAYETRVASDVLTVEVEGLEITRGPTCLALIPSSFTVALPSTRYGGPLTVDVRHRGETDRYTVQFDGEGPVLVPVHTSVTRPGPRTLP